MENYRELIDAANREMVSWREEAQRLQRRNEELEGGDVAALQRELEAAEARIEELKEELNEAPSRPCLSERDRLLALRDVLDELLGR